jgi:hypothetical protein
MSDLSDEAFKEWETSQPSIYNAVELAREWRKRAEAKIEQIEKRESQLFYLLAEWNRYYTHPDGDVKAFCRLVESTQKLLTEIGEFYLNEAYRAWREGEK